VSFWSDLLTTTDAAGVRRMIIGYAQSAGLAITNWAVGGVGQQILEAVTETIANVTEVDAYVIRSYASLDTATDPGDPDPYDPANVNRTPAAGGLSNLGENVYGTVRDGATFAAGTWTFDNTGGLVPRTFGPSSLVLTWTAVSPPNPPPVYYNGPDSSIYTNPDGTVTVTAGATLDIPIVAFQEGAASSAPPSAITLTTSLVGVTGTNAEAVVGVDRETATAYRARCRLAPARTSLGAPPATLEYLATTLLDGTPLTNASGNNVAINRVYVSSSSSTGIVDVYFASPDGAASTEDVAAANENIQVDAYAVFDCVTYTGQAATEVPISVVGTAKIKAGPGVVSATVRQAIVDALTAAFQEFPIGGEDQTLGAGVIYTRDLQAIAATAFTGLYAVSVTTPAGASTALALGEVATYAGTIADWTLTIV
jgi:hypothetical protein